MAVVIKNVAIVGASGTIGAPILKAIIESGKFNVSVLSRIGSKATFPPSVKVISVDATSVDSLTAALQGQDAVISAVGHEGFLGQSVLFDAAVAAGVKRFIPSEFGSDISNPNAAKLPVFGPKIAIRKHIEQKVKAGADITYTYVVNAPFLDWGIEVGFLLDYKEGKPRIFDGGDVPFSATSLPSVGLATVGVLTHYEETKNRQVTVNDIVITQNQLLELAKKAAPQKQWSPIPTKTSDLLEATNAAFGKGDHSVAVQYIFVAMFAEGYGGKLENVENELLGVPGKTLADLEAIYKRILT
ncbi:putative isoflavone reductase like protein P3 [Hyaloscypha variabilis F]|uniref:Putative isoflavone reductase like protein P3 n=1 Tax=Hyaloscypha variabilis (strain UAMH 11265 / GT02V1 / F) TaxID=1149755 RepID=A0A2J6RG85_HYAVF|nr:putative isoflavone reductase like protein P3 [Hyaloscypha variabilis F]